MKTFKGWLCHWLGAVSVFEYEHIRAADNQRIRDEYRSALMDVREEDQAATSRLQVQIADLIESVDRLAHELNEQTMGSQASIAEVITELNNLRNAIPAAAAQNAKPPVRLLRNFGEFRAVIEHKPRTERKS